MEGGGGTYRTFSIKMDGKEIDSGSHGSAVVSRPYRGTLSARPLGPPPTAPGPRSGPAGRFQY